MFSVVFGQRIMLYIIGVLQLESAVNELVRFFVVCEMKFLYLDMEVEGGISLEHTFVLY